MGTLKVLFIKAKLADSLYSHAVAMLERNNSLNHHSTVSRNMIIVVIVVIIVTAIFRSLLLYFLSGNYFAVLKLSN